MNAPDVQPDVLLHPGPQGFCTDLGWREASPNMRARMILQESVRAIEGAANALYSQCHLAEAGRASAIGFVARTLADQARLMKRAMAVQDRVESEASEARSATATRATSKRRSSGGPRS